MFSHPSGGASRVPVAAAMARVRTGNASSTNSHLAMPMRQRSMLASSRRTPARPLIHAVINRAVPGTIRICAALPGMTLTSAISSAAISDTLSPTANTQNARTGRRTAKARIRPWR